MAVSAKGHALERELGTDALHDDLVIDVVEDNVFVQAYGSEQKFVEG